VVSHRSFNPTPDLIHSQYFLLNELHGSICHMKATSLNKHRHVRHARVIFWLI